MRYVVNDRCIACGLCMATCPDVFSMGPNGKAQAIDSEVSDALRQDAEGALDSCPVNAIEHC